MERLVECVPNFSEGKDKSVIDAITSVISSIPGVELLDVDPGADTNRTVVTFVGVPDAAVEAAFEAIKKAAELIDMSKHHGAHPRMGATDVCPFIPVRGMSMDDCANLARELGQRVGEELRIPVYLYEYAATSKERVNLASIRQGEYEGLVDKLQKPRWKPDFGPSEFNKKSGATVIGARKFLIAYNVNLNTRSQRLAHNIALDIRERGRWMKDDDGKIIKDEKGKKLRKDGLLKDCKAVGWFIPEFDRAQVSINLTDFDETPPHKAFDTCCTVALNYGLRITGSEIVGLIPLEAMLQAGKYYLRKQDQSSGIPESMIIATAVQSLGLDELYKFNPQEKIIEYRIAKTSKRSLMAMQCNKFVDELSIDSPAPGGGSVAALCGALAAALTSMVANLTAGKKGFETIKPKMMNIAEEAQKLKDEFLADVDADTDAFNALMECMSMPKDTPELETLRINAIENATKAAIVIPMKVLERTIKVIEIAENVAEEGNPNSISDAGVAIVAIKAAAEGAYYNVIINLSGLTDTAYASEMKDKANRLRYTIDDKVVKAKTVVEKLLNA